MYFNNDIPVQFYINLLLMHCVLIKNIYFILLTKLQ